MDLKIVRIIFAEQQTRNFENRTPRGALLGALLHNHTQDCKVVTKMKKRLHSTKGQNSEKTNSSKVYVDWQS